MATDIVIPNVGESITTGVISRWNKQEGEFVRRDEPVLELETDKVTMEVPAPASGVLHRAAGEGDEVRIGAVVGKIDEAGAPAEAAPPPTPPAAPATGAPAPARPPVPPPDLARAPQRDGAEARGPAAAAADVRATPLARKMADEMGVDLSRVPGTGAGGRVREQDVLAFAQSRPGAAAAPAPPAERPAPAGGDGRAATRERMTPLRQRLAQRLVEAQRTAAMLTTFNECDMSAVIELRKRYKDDFEKRHGVGLGFMSFFVKAAVNALRAFPQVNAFIVQDESGQPAIEKHDYYDIAIAVAGPKGLVVPVIRNCEHRSFADIERAVKDLATRARDGKLTLEEMQGGTFTVTNGGIFGSLMSTPILNPPQSAILGMHAIKTRPVEHPAGSGQIALRPMMYLALSYDHRMIDGAESVRFLIAIKEAIEDPSRLLVGL